MQGKSLYVCLRLEIPNKHLIKNIGLQLIAHRVARRGIERTNS